MTDQYTEQLGATLKQYAKEADRWHHYCRLQSSELRTLNEVISRRKQATRRLHERLDAVKRMHTRNGDLCGECLKNWPCDTYIAANGTSGQGLAELLNNGDTDATTV